jgi:hypothetical protein
MEEFSDVRFKQRAVFEFLTAEKVPPIEIHRRMQAVYGDLCVDVSTVKGHLWVLQHLCLEGVLYSYPNEFLHSSPEVLHTKRRERPLLAKDGTISEFS